MKVKLTNEGINLAIEKLMLLEEEVDHLGLEHIVTKLTTQGILAAQEYAAGTPYSNPEPSVIKGGTLQYGKAGYIALQGDGAVYEEFGTGDEGANDPHPLKHNFPLNPYNSGPTIRLDEFDRHYWIYKPMAGEPYFDEHGKTHGIPSGKIMYNTSKHIRSIKDDIIRKEFEDIIKKFK